MPPQDKTSTPHHCANKSFQTTSQPLNPARYSKSPLQKHGADKTKQSLSSALFHASLHTTTFLYRTILTYPYTLSLSSLPSSHPPLPLSLLTNFSFLQSCHPSIPICPSTHTRLSPSHISLFTPTSPHSQTLPPQSSLPIPHYGTPPQKLAQQINPPFFFAFFYFHAFKDLQKYLYKMMIRPRFLKTALKILCPFSRQSPTLISIPHFNFNHRDKSVYYFIDQHKISRSHFGDQKGS